MASNLPIPVEQTGETDLVLRQVLQDVLGLSAERVARFDEDSGLFGHLPELDSMAVAGLLTELEDRLEILIEDDEVDGEMLETYGALRTFLAEKRADD
ncbi:acyl carrier protein [Aurantiacibacter aquimixticola]|uniref:Acyl carrier protein n=1 Tax=Aurantiacibacter aquimixticola TaxID=1958945 RepID=A0A419RS48_9SPHN|nr:phosphopantetheine-binding protein [Aurantiacibacter aquimixticola]RJY08611.1 acyl carrier protein [Aurantiacibacter aquimixticola]